MEAVPLVVAEEEVEAILRNAVALGAAGLATPSSRLDAGAVNVLSEMYATRSASYGEAL